MIKQNINRLMTTDPRNSTPYETATLHPARSITSVTIIWAAIKIAGI